VTRYYGQRDELHLAFDLPRMLHTPWNAPDWQERTRAIQASHAAVGAWPTIVLSNHDTPRHRTRLGSEARARAATVLLLTLPGTPFLYAGEELGLEDAVVPPERRIDPGGRDGCRAPIPWDTSPLHGWTATPWLPWPPDADARSVAALRDDPASILHLYRRLLAARRASPALQVGEWIARAAPAGVLAYERVAGEDRRLVMVNFTPGPIAVPAAGRVEVATDGLGEGGAWSGTLGPDGGVVLAPG
jgi:alpha-glucosidase